VKKRLPAGIKFLIAWLLFSRHGRARFSLYIFLTFAALRGLQQGAPVLTLLALLALAYFQLPAVRELYPRIDPRKVLSISGASCFST